MIGSLGNHGPPAAAPSKWVGTTVPGVDADRAWTFFPGARTPGALWDASRQDLLRAAGAAEATLLILALDDPVKIREH